MAQVLVLATLATKGEETRYLVDQLTQSGISARVIDISLNSNGAVLKGADKLAAMDRAAAQVLDEVLAGVQSDTEVVLGLGGGTGGEIVLNVLKALPVTFPKVLVTTLPFDPRIAVADNSIVLVPTLADLSGLNAILRDVLENAALICAGLCQKTRKGELTDVKPSVGVTALGATEGAIAPLVQALSEAGRESTVFHANGYGGAAFTRFAAHGAFNAIIDLTPHELTRIHIAGAHVDMPARFVAGADVPRVVLPGAMNFIGLGQKALVPSRYLERPHYEHSGYFTHVKVTPDEMELISLKLAESLNALTGPCAVIAPMGGFSHHDRPGDVIEDAKLRSICLETLKAKLQSHIPVTALDTHLFAPEVTETIMTTLAELSAQKDLICTT